ncbi:hypothetical protein QQF64_022453 [Cirrhinus molitorella]|uniref:Uncharacterized protein n=1 Tax=Cirrhinus molitorella TaxID=172907 RepID=A0ABR3L5Y3_9TELE
MRISAAHTMPALIMAPYAHLRRLPEGLRLCPFLPSSHRRRGNTGARCVYLRPWPTGTQNNPVHCLFVSPEAFESQRKREMRKQWKAPPERHTNIFPAQGACEQGPSL